MLIAIDMRSVGEKLCGVSRMAANLVRALAKLDTQNQYILYTSRSGQAPITKAPNFTEKYVPIRRYSFEEHCCFRNIVGKDMPDLFHSLHQSLPFFWDLPVKRLVTVCDLFAPKYPWFFESHGYITKLIAKFYFDIMMRRTLRQADLIVAISQYTKRDILEKYNVPEGAVRVIHLAAGDQGVINDTYTDSGSTQSPPNSPYCLFIGNFKRYKNIEGAIAAVAKFNKTTQQKTIKLVVVGNDEKNLPRVQDYAKNSGVLENIVFMRYVTDTTLRTLYGNAVCLLFPSLYEGFGMPVLEAMSVGVPVVCSNTTSLPEVAGDAALFVDPLNTQSIADSIGRILENKNLREELVRKGHENSRRFSWEETARQYLKIYQEIISK